MTCVFIADAKPEELQKACPTALVIVLISHLDARQKAALFPVPKRLSVNASK